ncbi:MAG TPA: hypothetical protein VN040_24465, partial [Pseudosphingobacterium sp.]|nr:hypothetical protein [Pseudosphingobacterium sp.]
TASFQVIYPAEFEEEAQRLTNKMEQTIKVVQKSIGIKPRKISIILQNRDVVSNGFVQLAPRRSEFSTTPPQEMDYQDWLNSLAVHELRHVVQFDKLTGYLKPPLFEQLALAIFGITLPPWFYEGDAVGIETALSSAGRGRLPSWEMPFRTNTLSGAKYSYQKDFFGSFKNITPGYYQLGYFMTTKMRNDYGINFLDSLLTDIKKNPIRPYNFSSTLQKFTGYNTKKWHDKTVRELDSLWRHQLAKTQPINYSTFPQQKQEVIDFLLPQMLPNGNILAIQRSYHSVPKIVSIDSQNAVTEIIKTGIQTQAHFSYRANKITWDEMRYDKRYLKQTFHVINVFDLNTNRYKQLTHKTRFFAPALSHQGDSIATVEINLRNEVSLVILNSNTGKELNRIKIPEGIVVQSPYFKEDGKRIITIARGEKGTTLMEIDLQANTCTFLIDWQAQQMERPIYTPHGILFKSHFNGIDNIYLLSQSRKTIKQVTNVSFGAFNPSYDEQRAVLLFNNYQATGYLISKIKIDKNKLDSVSRDENYFISYFKPLLSQENQKDNTTTVEQKIFASSAYNEAQHLFNFHSISPVGDDISSIDNFDLGLQLMSDNMLNTFSTRIGFNYDQNTSRSDYFVSASFKKWFPKISVQYRNQAQLSSVRPQNNPNERIPLRWREHYTEIKATIPLTFNKLNTIYSSGLSIGTSYTKRYQISIPNLNIANFDKVNFPLLVQYYFNRNERRSLQDLAPKWGQNFNFIYRNLAFDKRLSGTIFSMKSTFYFPGLTNNHSFQTRFNFQQRSGDYNLTNDIPMVSGYDQLASSKVNNTLFVDYRFPIAYPDLDIGPLAFVKRLKGGFFADFENFTQRANFSPRTFGIELRADMNLLRFYLPNFDAGIRAIYVNESNPQKIIFTYGLSYTY